MDRATNYISKTKTYNKNTMMNRNVWPSPSGILDRYVDDEVHTDDEVDSTQPAIPIPKPAATPGRSAFLDRFNKSENPTPGTPSSSLRPPPQDANRSEIELPLVQPRTSPRL